MKQILLAMFLSALAMQANAQRTYLTPATYDFYVSTTGNDANDCRQSTPCLTIQRAVDNIKQNYDTNCIRPYIYIADGSYAGWSDYAPQVGCQPSHDGGGPLAIVGNCSNPANVVINAVSQTKPTAISYDGGAIGTVICMTVSSPGAPGIYATNGAILEVGLINFPGGIYGIMADAGGTIIATSTLNFTGNYVYGIMGNLSGYASVVPGVVVSFASGVNFSGQFVFAANHGVVVFPIPGVTISGSPTGQKCFASLGGVVNTGLGNNALIPGNIVCGSNYGGQVY